MKKRMGFRSPAFKTKWTLNLTLEVANKIREIAKVENVSPMEVVKTFMNYGMESYCDDSKKVYPIKETFKYRDVMVRKKGIS